MYILFLFLLLAILWVETKEPFTVKIETDGFSLPNMTSGVEHIRNQIHYAYRKGLQYIPYRENFHKMRRQFKI